MRHRAELRFAVAEHDPHHSDRWVHGWSVPFRSGAAMLHPADAAQDATVFLQFDGLPGTCLREVRHQTNPAPRGW